MSTPSEQDKRRWAAFEELRAELANPDLTEERRQELIELEGAMRAVGITEVLMQEAKAGEPDCWWWLSFADGSLPEGEQFLGVSIVKAHGMMEAVLTARLQGLNPGGEVQGVPIPEEHVPDEQYRERLMSFAELQEAGLV